MIDRGRSSNQQHLLVAGAERGANFSINKILERITKLIIWSFYLSNPALVSSWIFFLHFYAQLRISTGLCGTSSSFVLMPHGTSSSFVLIMALHHTPRLASSGHQRLTRR